MLLHPSQGVHQNGRLCGGSLPSRRNTTSNYLHVTFHSEAGSSAGQGFKLQFRELSFGCGGRIQLTADISSVEARELMIIKRRFLGNN